MIFIFFCLCENDFIKNKFVINLLNNYFKNMVPIKLTMSVLENVLWNTFN